MKTGYLGLAAQRERAVKQEHWAVAFFSVLEARCREVTFSGLGSTWGKLRFRENGRSSGACHVEASVGWLSAAVWSRIQTAEAG